MAKAAASKEHYPDTHHDIYSKTIFGFWVYLVTDFMMFATFFAAFAVLHHSFASGLHPKELFYLPFNLVQTLIILAVSFLVGLGNIYAHKRKVVPAIMYYGMSGLLGCFFVAMIFSEFHHFLTLGQSWQKSAYLSCYFTIIGMIALHAIIAILWTVLLLIPLFINQEINGTSLRRLTCLRLLWQFINIVWIFAFCLVYLLGVN